jgi:hypothetical protein
VLCGFPAPTSGIFFTNGRWNTRRKRRGQQGLAAAPSTFRLYPTFSSDNLKSFIELSRPIL